MFISIQELELHNVFFEEEFRPHHIELGPGLEQRQGLKTKGRAELLEEHGHRRGVIQDIRLVGDFSTQVEVRCARCLEPVVNDVAESFDLVYRPLGADAGRAETSVTGADVEIGYYHGEGLLLEDVLREQVLLALPLRSICREDCKGLCARCGRNLNSESCQCPDPLADQRWEALKGLRDKLKS